MNDEISTYQWDILQSHTNMVSEKLIVYITDTTSLTFEDCARWLHALRKQNVFFENGSQVSMNLNEKSFESIIRRKRRTGETWGIVTGKISENNQLSIHVKVGIGDGIFAVVPLLVIAVVLMSITSKNGMVTLAVGVGIMCWHLFESYNEKAKLLDALKRIFDATGAAHLH